MSNKSYPTLVVLGTRTDRQIDRVIKKITLIGGVNVCSLDYQNLSTFAISISALGEQKMFFEGVAISHEYLVWDAARILPGTNFYTHGDESTSGFLALEWRSFYRLFCELSNEAALNSLVSRRCVLKPYQQIMAAKAGFLVPRSIVSNDKSEIAQFSAQNSGKTILKSLSGGRLTPAGEGEAVNASVFTMSLASCDLNAEDEAQFSCCPHFIQYEIEKAFELRVVFVNQQIFAYYIDSQRQVSTKTDWRRNFRALKFMRFSIDKDLHHKLLNYVQLAGFFSGSIDLIVDKQGNTWFLECNEDGHWEWLDDGDDGVISDAFARELHRKTLQRRLPDLPPGL